MLGLRLAAPLIGFLQLRELSLRSLPIGERRVDVEQSTMSSKLSEMGSASVEMRSSPSNPMLSAVKILLSVVGESEEDVSRKASEFSNGWAGANKDVLWSEGESAGLDENSSEPDKSPKGNVESKSDVEIIGTIHTVLSTSSLRNILNKKRLRAALLNQMKRAGQMMWVSVRNSSEHAGPLWKERVDWCF